MKDKIKALKESEAKLRPWQLKIKEVIYGTKTPAGKLFDLILLIVILLSIVIIMLETVPYYNERYSTEFLTIELIITGLFTIEYILRIISVKKPLKYMFSFLGIIDLLSILPTYLSLFITGSKPFTVIRCIRFLRIFHILEMSDYTKGGNTLIKALFDSRHKIIVFIISMMTIVIILGALMYSIEPKEAGFTSIPRSVYWAIITITTVGYGDIAPVTTLGQALASIIMLIGYSILAVPTGIVSAEIAKQQKQNIKPYTCKGCGKSGHEENANFCVHCGEKF